MVAQFNNQLEENKNTNDLPEFPELRPVHVKHLLSEGFTPEIIADWVKQGLISLTKEEALKKGFKAWVNKEWKSGSGLYLPFTPTFGQLRLDEPIIRDNGKPAKYLTPYKVKTQAYLPDRCKVITEGIKDAMAGTKIGGIPTGAIAGVSHYKKALKKLTGYTILFDADGWINPQVFLNLFNAGVWVNGKVQLLPEIPRYPKAGLCEYFKAGYTADDYKKLIATAMKPKELLIEWPSHWDKIPSERISQVVKMALKLAAWHLEDEIDRERLLYQIKRAAKLNVLKLRHLLQREIDEISDYPPAKRLKPEEVARFIQSKYGKDLRMNELGNIIELDGEEYDIDAAYIHLLMHRNVYASKYFVADIFRELAKMNSYNPVKKYLLKTKNPDNPISIDNLSSRYFGTTNPLYDLFLKKTLIAAVARAFEPGCKVDTTLVLQGDQGLGKSTFFKILGGKFFDDNMGDGRDKDDLLKLHKCWIEEWGEVERVFSKRQAGELKAFLSRSSDLFREPYARSAKEHPRHSIIVATVNKSDFLVDSTGNRRYWVIPVQSEYLDLTRLKEERDLIWGAAVAAYEAGETWWLSREEAQLSENNNAHFQIVDEWEAAIANFVENKKRTSVTQILEKCFDFEMGKMDRSSQMRVATILSSLNWQKVGMRELDGKRQQCWERIPIKIPVATNEVEIEVATAESTEITGSSQPLNLNPESFEVSKKASLQVDAIVKKERAPSSFSEKNNLEKFDPLGCEVASSLSNQGFQSSQPRNPEQMYYENSLGEEGRTEEILNDAVNSLCDSFGTGTREIDTETLNALGIDLNAIDDESVEQLSKEDDRTKELAEKLRNCFNLRELKQIYDTTSLEDSDRAISQLELSHYQRILDLTAEIDRSDRGRDPLHGADKDNTIGFSLKFYRKQT